MAEFIDENYETDQPDIEILVDVLRQCFLAGRARYYIAVEQNSLFVEIEGLEEFSQEEIAEVAEPILEEFDLDFDEIVLLPMNAS
jgi:hypothetical protein